MMTLPRSPVVLVPVPIHREPGTTPPVPGSGNHHGTTWYQWYRFELRGSSCSNTWPTVGQARDT